MDPLSVMASVVGLVGAAGKVGSILLAVKKSISDAPRLMDEMISQVRELEIYLSAVQNFLLGMNSAPRGRISMIRVDQLIAIFTEAVLTFSELEALVTSIARDNGLSIATRLIYVWKEDAIASIILRLERHKSSLSHMLNIAQCESDLEAEKSRETLENLVEELLRNNQDISRRLRSIEDSLESRSIMTSCFRNGTMDGLAEGEAETENIQQDVGPPEFRRTRSSLVTQNFTEDASPNCFQADLGTSRVYKRTEQYESDVSFTSSAVRTHAWSIFPGLSLSEVSVISAIALPLCLDDVSNKEWYMPGGLEHTNLQFADQVPNGSPPFESGADIAPNPASDSTLQKLKKSRPRLFLRRNLNEGSSDGLVPSKSRNIRIAKSADASIERPASSTSKRSRQIVSRTAVKNSGPALYKLVVLGDNDVGKTELTTQLTTLSHYSLEGYDSTIEDSYRTLVNIDGQDCMLELLDTAGQEYYTALRDYWIRDGEGFLLVYSTTKRSSFTHIQRYHNSIARIKEQIYPCTGGFSSNAPFYLAPLYPIMLVGNNIDEEAEREVSTQEGCLLAKELGCNFVEASAKNSINVEKALHDVARAIRLHRMVTADSAILAQDPLPGKKKIPRQALV